MYVFYILFVVKNTFFVLTLNTIMPLKLCVDPEKNYQLLSNFDVFVFYEGFEDLNLKYCYKRAIIGPPAKRHLNGVSLAC